ncbi:MAG: tRNA (adenosine(37)-N6)-threonylcarbamoyltransferase complex ATPase subunit type 1 TsaE [Patescibacteria group bacterium]|nr:tRNA (adenosine(37)-N6)-threonylcarbamoyltransferase complex ATPase subunit type 1 TsaE [Patescibacteria group bacterium]
MKIITKNEEGTLAFAEKYAKDLLPGQIIGLIGDLGAGKTIFTKGLAKGLGVQQNISSPTFNIMRLYEIRATKTNQEIKKFCHIDAYRVESEFEIIDVGVEDFIGQKDTITVIEWADKIRNILPGRTIIINIKLLKKDQREIIIDQKK